MKKVRIGNWMRRRMAKRLQKKLGLRTGQIAELMPILGKMRRPHAFSSDAERAQLVQTLRAEPLDTVQLNQLITERLKRYKQTLDEQALALTDFVSEMDIMQREKLTEMVSAEHGCRHKMS